MRLFPPEGCIGKDIENNTSEGEEEARAHRRKTMIRSTSLGRKGTGERDIGLEGSFFTHE